MGPCPKCGTLTTSQEAFCPECGKKLHAGRGDTASRPTTEQLDLARDDSDLRSARQAILVVAILTIIFGGFQWFLIENEAVALSNDPTVWIDEDAITQARFAAGAVIGVGALFIGFYFWARKNPFAATLTALVIYVTGMIADLAVDPANLFRGIIIKILIVAALIKGVKAGLAWKQWVTSKGEAN